MRRLELDLSEADDIMVTFIDVLIKKLKRHKLYEDHFLYSIIDGSRVKEFVKHGTCRPNSPTIFSFRADELRGDEFRSWFMGQYDETAMAIYDRHHFSPAIGVEEYEFKNPRAKKDAIVALINRIIWKNN